MNRQKLVFNKFIDNRSSLQNIYFAHTNNIADIQKEWRYLENFGVQSPAQTYDFTKVWINNLEIEPRNQFFSIVTLDKRPIILMALEKRKKWGLTIFTPFFARHVGTNAPLIDSEQIAKLSLIERKAVWQAAIEPIKNSAHLLFFPHIIENKISNIDPYDKLGLSCKIDNLYRAEFNNWQQIDKERRNRSRRKHDKQHRAKLSKLGNVTFEEIMGNDVRADKIIALMFRQRAERFAKQGIKNPFSDEKIKKFYYQAIKLNNKPRGSLHILRLDNEIIAVRYNIIFREKIFCLISSMTNNPTIQRGGPGKQNLLYIMQTIFENGAKIYDMGAGLTDEKRIWCNRKINLRHYYRPLTLLGFILSLAALVQNKTRYKIKNNQFLFNLIKRIRKV